jgi:hypothetical protein
VAVVAIFDSLFQTILLSLYFPNVDPTWKIKVICPIQDLKPLGGTVEVDRGYLDS